MPQQLTWQPGDHCYEERHSQPFACGRLGSGYVRRLTARAAQADDYWDGYWGWYDNSYRPYYQRYYSRYPYSDNYYGRNYYGRGYYDGYYNDGYSGRRYSGNYYGTPNLGYRDYPGNGGAVRVGPLRFGWR